MKSWGIGLLFCSTTPKLMRGITHSERLKPHRYIPRIDTYNQCNIYPTVAFSIKVFMVTFSPFPVFELSNRQALRNLTSKAEETKFNIWLPLL